MFVWEDVLNLNVEDLQGDPEELYRTLVSASVDPNDTQSTPTNLVHLLRVFQVVLQLKNDQVIELKEDVADKATTVKNQNLELKRLRKDGGSSDVRALQEELIELEKKCDAAVRELDTMEDLLDTERQATAQAQSAAREEKSKLRGLEDSNKRLEAELRETRMHLQTQRGRLQTRQSDEEQHRALINQKNQELNRYIEEVQMLSTENSQLSQELDEVTGELEAAMGELEKVQAEFDGVQKALQDSELRIEELVDERDALRIRVEDLTDQLDSFQTDKQATVTLLENQILFLNSQVDEEQQKSNRLEEMVDKLKMTIKKLRNSEDSMLLDELKQELQQKDVTIEQLKSKLNDLQGDFKLLAQDWDRAEQMASRKRQSSAPVTPTTDVEKLTEKYSILKLRRKEDTEKIKHLVEEVALKEKEVLKLEERLQKFEMGTFGLKDALSEIKLLKAKGVLQEKQLDELTTRINDLEAQGEDLIEENCALRDRLGLEFTELDLSNFKNMKMIELEKAKSLILTLKSEIDKLEEERIALKSKVRLQALERGERAVELGLDAADLMAVEEYAEKLRAGTIPSGRSASRPSVPQLDGLLVQLERSYIEHTETREKLQQTEDRLKQAFGELQVFESALMEMSRSFMESKDQLGDVTKTMPNVEMLISLLQSKQVAHTNPKVKQAFVEVEESMYKANGQLKKEVSSLNAQLNRQKAETDHFRTLSDNLRTENLKLKMELENGNDHIRRPRTAIEIDSSAFGQSSVGFSNILEQLVDTLIVVEEQGQQLVENGELLEQYKKRLTPLAIRTRLLYKQYIIERDAHKLLNRELSSRLENCELEKASLQEQVNSLQKALDLVKQDPDSLKGLYVDIQRKYVVLESQALSLARRHEAMVTTEKFLTKENERLKRDLLELDVTARQTIARLAKREKECKHKITRLQEEMQDSISLTEYRVLENKLRIYIEKTRLLTERERDRIGMVIDHETEMIKIRDLERRLQKLELSSIEYKEKAAAFDLYVSSAKDNGDYLADSYWRPKNASLQIQIQVLEKRALMAEEQSSQAISMQEKMKKQLDSTDRLYIESKEETICLQEKHLELLNKYEGGATREDFQHLNEKVVSLQMELEKIKSELDYEKDLTDTANSQAMQLQSQLKQDQNERDLLKAAVKELQMLDDEKLVIGKLHQHILTLQKQEISHKDELQKLNIKCLRLEKIVVQQENQLSSQDQFIFELRMKSKKQIQFLHKTLALLQNKLAGCVLFEKHERACRMSARLNDLRNNMKENLEGVQRENSSLQDQLLILNQTVLLNKELQDIINNPSAAQKRILQWHKRLADAETRASLAERRLEKLRESNSMNESNAEFYQQKVEELHDQLLSIQNEHDSQQLAWEQQQSEFEKMIAQYEEERDRLYLSTTAGELKDTLPDRSLPVGEQLEQALRKLIERTRQINFLKIQNEDLETKLKGQLESIQQTNKALNDTTYRMKKLEGELERVRSSSAASNTTEIGPTQDEHGTQSDRSRIREANALRAAHETMVSLQKQLKQKNEMMEKYRSMVQSVRDELTAKTLEHDAIDQKNKELQLMLQREIDRFHTSEKENPTATEREIVAEVEMINELQRLLNLKETLVGELEEKLLNAQKIGKQEKEDYEKKVHDMELEATVLKEEIERLRQTEENLKVELQQACNRLAVPPVKDLSDVVHRLQTDLEGRDSKIATLTKAIHKLKNQLVAMSKELAETKINSNVGGMYSEEMVQQRMLPLTRKILQLEAKLKKVSENPERDRVEFKQFEQDMKRMTEELVQKNSEISKLKAEIQESVSRLKAPQKGDKDAAPHTRLSSWENEKNFSKKIEQLKEKLKQRNAEVESLQDTIQSSREAYDRSEKDRLKLQNRLQKLTKELSDKNAEFENERQVLQSQNKSLQQMLENPMKSRPSADRLQNPPLPLSDLEKALENQSREDLMNTITKLSAQITKQKSSDATKSLRKDLETQKAAVHELERQIQNYKKIEGENTSLRQTLRKESEKVKSLHAKLDESKLANDTMVKEIVELRKVISKVEPESGKSVLELTQEIAELKRLLVEKENTINGLMNPDTDEVCRMQADNRKLKREVEMLQIRVAKLTEETSKSSFSYKLELDNLKKEHNACLQEIEDLRYNYKEALKQNMILESRIK